MSEIVREDDEEAEEEEEEREGEGSLLCRFFFGSMSGKDINLLVNSGLHTVLKFILQINFYLPGTGTVHLVKIRELKIQTPSIATHGARLDSTVKKTTIRALK